jgi:hypothetical protein
MNVKNVGVRERHRAVTAMKYQRNDRDAGDRAKPIPRRNLKYQVHGEEAKQHALPRGHTAVGGSSVAIGSPTLGANVLSWTFGVARAVAVSTGRSRWWSKHAG